MVFFHTFFLVPFSSLSFLLFPLSRGFFFSYFFPSPPFSLLFHLFTSILSLFPLSFSPPFILLLLIDFPSFPSRIYYHFSSSSHLYSFIFFIFLNIFSSIYLLFQSLFSLHFFLFPLFSLAFSFFPPLYLPFLPVNQRIPEIK